jgi:glutathione S-transferase
MPKLYYTATSCGAASFISAHTAGLRFECETVDLQTHRTASGADFYAVNPKGNVGTLVLDDGTLLNENVAILSYIADKVIGNSNIRWMVAVMIA